VSKNFKQTIIFSAVIAVFSVVMGISLSFFLDIPTGATIVLINVLLFLAAFTVKLLGK